MRFEVQKAHQDIQRIWVIRCEEASQKYKRAVQTKNRIAQKSWLNRLHWINVNMAIMEE
jgi:hypothetical protein